MKDNPVIYIVKFSLFMLLQAGILSAETQAEIIPMQGDYYEHIKFGTIKASHYTFHNQQLQVDVNNSASILMLPFDTVKHVKQISFEWRSEGRPDIKNVQHELKRNGDDAVFKLGLLLKTENTLPNPLFRPWIKQVTGLLNFPSEKMIYLVADSKHAAGEQWVNPYNRRITMVSVKSVDDKQGWQKSSYTFRLPLNVVALWLMADGDNTQSSFTSYIKNIKIE